MKNNHLEETYVGLSAAQIDVATRVPTNFQKAPKNVREALIARRLFTEEGKPTKLCLSVFRVCCDIWTDRFIPVESVSTDAEAAILNDPQKISRQKSAKDLQLSSAHVKFMRILLNRPGISIFTLEKIFAVYLFNDLISRGLASRHEDSHQIFPTDKGIVFIRGCIAEVVSKGNTGQRKYPENGDGLEVGTNPSGHPLKLCECGGVVDLTPAKKKGNKNG